MSSVVDNDCKNNEISSTLHTFVFYSKEKVKTYEVKDFATENTLIKIGNRLNRFDNSTGEVSRERPRRMLRIV